MTSRVRLGTGSLITRVSGTTGTLELIFGHSSVFLWVSLSKGCTNKEMRVSQQWRLEWNGAYRTNISRSTESATGGTLRSRILDLHTVTGIRAIGTTSVGGQCNYPAEKREKERTSTTALLTMNQILEYWITARTTHHSIWKCLSHLFEHSNWPLIWPGYPCM
jgi:hypothetical protein